MIRPNFNINLMFLLKLQTDVLLLILNEEMV